MSKPTIEELKKKREEDEKYLESIPFDKQVSVTIDGGNLVNESPVDGGKNPHECQLFTWAIKYKNIKDDIKHIKWVLTGNFPYDVDVNPITGIISGNIRILNEQPFITDIIPAEKMKNDGSNWYKLGRPAGMFYDFEFYVTRVYELPPPESGSGSGTGTGNNKSSSNTGTEESTIVKSLPSKHIIRVIRSHTIDNYIIAKSYLMEREDIVEFPETDMPPEILPREFVIYDKHFNIDSFDELLKVHPGPWPKIID